MTRPQVRKLDKLIERIECFYQEVDDRVAREQIYHARDALLSLYNSAKRDCAATEKA